MRATERKTVVITGASSGIGRASVARMIQSGWQVFAAVRKADDGARLQRELGANVSPIILDLKDRASIGAASEQVAQALGDRGLHGLVNVAGIGIVRPVEYATRADLEEIFDINVFGQVAVIQAFLPLLRRARGRIVNITSVGANLPIPFGGLLNASKSAFGLLSGALRLELQSFGVQVAIVEPGAIRTPAVDKTLGDVEGVIAGLPAGGAAQYGSMMREFVKRGYAREMNGSPPEVVAEPVHHALTATRPRILYRVGKHARLLSTLPRILPARWLDALLLRITGMGK